MKFVKLLAIASFAVASLGLSSCGCCSGEAALPSLRRLPSFKDVPVQQDAPAARKLLQLRIAKFPFKPKSKTRKRWIFQESQGNALGSFFDLG